MRQNKSLETFGRKKETNSNMAKSNVDFNYVKKGQDRMIIPNSPDGDDYGYDYDYYTDNDYDYGEDYTTGNENEQESSFITDDLPTVQFDTEDGSRYTQNETQSAESGRNSSLDNGIRIPVFRFPTHTNERRQRRRFVRSSNSSSKESTRKHFKAPTLDTQTNPEFDSSTTGISQKKHLSPAPKFITEMDTASDIEDAPHSPTRRLKRRQRQLEALKQKQLEDENNPTIPNDSFSDDETTNPLKPFEIAAEEFRKRAAEEKERQMRLEEERRRRQLQEDELRRQREALEQQQQEANKQEQLRIPRVRTRTRGTATYSSTQDGSTTYTTYTDQSTENTNNSQTQDGENTTVQTAGGTIRRYRRQRGQQIVPELAQQEQKQLNADVSYDDRPPPIQSPPSTTVDTSAKRFISTNNLVEELPPAPQPVQQAPQASQAQPPKPVQQAPPTKPATELKKVPLNPQNNEAVNNLMNDIESKQSFFASLDKEGKKSIFVSEDDLLEQLPTIGNGIEVDEIPPVREAPEITEPTHTNTQDRRADTMQHHTTTSELPDTAHMVQMDEVEQIYIDKPPEEELESLPPVEDFGPPPPDPISGSAVVDLVTETTMKKAPVQEVLPLSDIEDSLIESYTSTRDAPRNLPPALQKLKPAEPEVLSIDSQGNTPTTESYTSVRKRPTRGKSNEQLLQQSQQSRNDNSTTIDSSTASVTTASTQRKSIIANNIDESSTLESDSTYTSSVTSRPTNSARFISDKNQITSSITTESETGPQNSLQQRILANQKYIEEKNRQAEEKRLQQQKQQQEEEERRKEQQRQIEEAERQRRLKEEQERAEREQEIEQQRIAEEKARAERERAEKERLDRERLEALQKQQEEERRKQEQLQEQQRQQELAAKRAQEQQQQQKQEEEAQKQQQSPTTKRIEDPRLRQKAAEAERMRQRLQLEQKIRPDPYGNERAILALPTETTTVTNDHRADTVDSGLMYAQIQPVQTADQEVDSTSIESKISFNKNPIRDRLQQLNSTTQESTTKGKMQDAEFLDPEPTLPDTLSTVAPTTMIHEDKANCFKESTYRNTQPTVTKQTLLPNPEKFIPSKIQKPIEPVDNWPRFQINLIPLPNNTEPSMRASAKYDFETLLNNIRAV